MKQKAGWCCERCGHPHDPRAGYTLTVHHLDGDKQNCRSANLAVLCQRCHLSVQGKFDPRQPEPPEAVQLGLFGGMPVPTEGQWEAKRRRQYREVFGG